MKQIRNKIKSQIIILEKEEVWKKSNPHFNLKQNQFKYKTNLTIRKIHNALYKTVRKEVARTESVMINLRDISIARNEVARLEALGI